MTARQDEVRVDVLPTQNFTVPTMKRSFLDLDLARSLRPALTALVAVLVCTISTQAENFPSRTVRIIVPFTAGGANDGVARALADRLSKKWGQSVVVENRPGGATTIGTRAVIEAAPDGHTLLFTSSSSFVVTPHTTKLNFDPLKDLEPVLLAVSVAPALAIGNHLPVQDRRRVHRLRQGASRQTDLRVRRHRHLFARRRRTLQAACRHRHGARSLWRHLSGDHRHARRPDRRLHGRARRLPGPRTRRQAQGARHGDAGAASRPARPADDRRDREGLRRRCLVRGLGTGETPAALLDKLHDDMADILHDPAFIDGFVRPQGFTAPKLSRAQFAERLRSDFVLWGGMVERAGLKKQP